MSSRSVTIKNLGTEVAERLKSRIVDKQIGHVLVSNAQRRIANSGDSEIKYETLWATKVGLGHRAGGEPLRSTGALMAGLDQRTVATTFGVRLTVIDGAGYGVKHQEGFVNMPPIAVPLNASAEQIIPPDSPHDIAQIRAMGLEEGEDADFIVLHKPATVPARPIHRMAPEDIEELTNTITDIAKGI